MERPPILGIVEQLFKERGDVPCFGEVVTQQQHALQCAYLARKADAKPSLIVAALLHDVGHMLVRPRDRDKAPAGPHESVGSSWLAQYFGEDVFEPVRLHVEAKRFLCAVDPDYYEALSTTARQHLALRGGPLTDDEVTAFERQPFARHAVRLRRWDDRARTPRLHAPDLRKYTALLMEETRRAVQRV